MRLHETLQPEEQGHMPGHLAGCQAAPAKQQHGRSVRGNRELRVLPVLRLQLGARGPGAHSRRLRGRSHKWARGQRQPAGPLPKRYYGCGQRSSARPQGHPLTLLPLRNKKARTCVAVTVTAHAWLQARPRPRPAQLTSRTCHRCLQTLCTDAKSGRTAASLSTRDVW